MIFTKPLNNFLGCMYVLVSYLVATDKLKQMRVLCVQLHK